MRSCSSCGATVPVAAAWCGQCFAAAPAGPVPVPASGIAATVGTLPAGGLTGSTVALAVAEPVAEAVAVPASPLPPARVDVGGDRSPMLGRHAILLVLAAIAVGAVGSAVSWVLGRDASLEPATYIRYVIVGTVAVYVVVGALVVTQLAPTVRLRWTTGSPFGAVVVGVTVGGGLGALLLVGVSAQAGHLSPDERIVVTMSEGDLSHILVTLLLTCVCAPLIEEVLFRGLLLESLRRHHVVVAVVVSGVAFSVWHLNPSALRYYALMGGLFGVLYVRRGLVCSIAAHATFNGVLAVAALAVVLAPAHTVQAGDLSVEVPGGWSAGSYPGAALDLDGPSGASFVVAEIPNRSVPSPDTVQQRIRGGVLSAALPGVSVDTGTVRREPLPVGDAVAVDVSAGGHRGTMMFVPLAGHSLEMVFLSGGSVRAQADFDRLVRSLRVG